MKRSQRLKREARREWLYAVCGMVVSTAGILWAQRVYDDMPGVAIVMGILVLLLGGIFVLGALWNAILCTLHAWREQGREMNASIRAKADEGRRAA